MPTDVPAQMTALAVDSFGGPEKLTAHTLPVPSLDAGEVLIRVEAAGVGVWDVLEREGKLVYNAVRFPRILGSESAGRVVAVGPNVIRAKVGDRVYAQTFMNDKGGSYADYVAVSEQTIARIPNNLDMTQAGAFPISGMTALRNLEAAKVGPGSTLLLWAASGGVGHVALQLAKRLGARVLAVASGDDGLEFVRSLGADDAVDGRRDDVLARGRSFAPHGFDAAVLFVNNDVAQASLGLVRKGGVVAFPSGVTPEPKPPAGVTLTKADGFGDPEAFDRLNALVEQGDFRVHVAETFPFSQAAEAQESTKKHFLGKIVLVADGR